ncbi:hypothetical protein L2E82_38894 [Cichorium intybus]|uniref:Uncharacterized protein n=1 Tax=Cichorium intybus TaxID=13427 RepID=A0ACB9AL30_CICIN|nr:hypothetical protein L2E82_38894 [Cichorium intybus]
MEDGWIRNDMDESFRRLPATTEDVSSEEGWWETGRDLSLCNMEVMADWWMEMVVGIEGMKPLNYRKYCGDLHILLAILELKIIKCSWILETGSENKIEPRSKRSNLFSKKSEVDSSRKHYLFEQADWKEKESSRRRGRRKRRIRGTFFMVVTGQAGTSATGDSSDGRDNDAGGR